MSVVLSIDIGTSKIAAVAFEQKSKTCAAVVSAVNSSTVPGLPPGRHEQNPELILAECVSLLVKLIEAGKFEPNAVESVAVSGQMHGVLLVDVNLRPLTNLITWCDQRAAGVASGIDRSTWPSHRTGCHLHPGYGGATLSVLAAEGRIPKGAKALTIADFVVARLCGVAATEPTHAASWGILDAKHGRRWGTESVSLLGIPPDILPEIRPSMSILGTMSNTLGLSGNIVVRSPIGDNQASFIGACGLDNSAPLLNLGTGGQISLPCPEFIFHPELETRPMPFGGFLLVGASLCGGRAYAMLKDFFKQTVAEFTGQTLSDGELYAAMNRMAESAGTGLSVDTRFAGTRLTPSARGGVSGIGVDNFTPSAFCAGLVRGMVGELTGMVPPKSLQGFSKAWTAGNAVRMNPAVQRVIAEELGLPCESTAGGEEAAVGAAMAASKAAGMAI